MRIRKFRKRSGHNSQADDAMPPGFFNPDMMPFGLDPEGLNRSIEQCWSEHWVSEGLAERYGERTRNPAAESNPRAEQWFYPKASKEAFQIWMREFFAGGQFEVYLKKKVEHGEIPPALAAQVLNTILRGARMGSA
ncbi:MAG: hypothetical protein U0236_10965 [Nitrospira sp.]